MILEKQNSQAKRQLCGKNTLPKVSLHQLGNIRIRLARQLLNVCSASWKHYTESEIRTKLSMEKLTAFRKFYADLVLANGNVSTENQRLLHGFNSIHRESFLGPGPWHIFTANGYITTPSANPELLYQDILVALDPESNINNGQPSLHARCIDALDISEGEHVAHIGAGTGYYSLVPKYKVKGGVGG